MISPLHAEILEHAFEQPGVLLKRRRVDRGLATPLLLRLEKKMQRRQLEVGGGKKRGLRLLLDAGALLRARRGRLNDRLGRARPGRLFLLERLGERFVELRIDVEIEIRVGDEERLAPCRQGCAHAGETFGAERKLTPDRPPDHRLRGQRKMGENAGGELQPAAGEAFLLAFVVVLFFDFDRSPTRAARPAGRREPDARTQDAARSASDDARR